MKPFLKWAGNKYRIIGMIQKSLPQGRRLIEPFCGSCAVFMNTEFESYLLSDVNQDLIDLYCTLQSLGQAFIDYASELFTAENNTSDAYYALREEFNTTDNNTLRKSALFLYLNKHGYNGLCRYNTRGRFNVPFGKFTKPYFPEREMQFFYEKARQAEFACQTFDTVMNSAAPGDVVYCDPPYVPLSQTAKFTNYSCKGFTTSDQLHLTSAAKELSARGIPVLISNHCNEFTLQNYATASIESFDVQRTISCHGTNRAKVTEVLALFTDTSIGHDELQQSL